MSDPYYCRVCKAHHVVPSLARWHEEHYGTDSDGIEPTE